MKLTTRTAAATDGERPPTRSVRWRFAAGLAATALFIAALLGAFLLGALAHADGTVSSLFLAIRGRTIPSLWIGTPWASNRLPSVDIDMKFAGVQRLAAKRDEALRSRILNASETDFVSATWRFQGRAVAVKMRLKGDWTDHLLGDKWSYRVHVAGTDALFGMRRFSIQHPATRNYLAEWAFLEHLRSEGVIAPRYGFINVAINGRKLGIYATEESFSKELLESSQRREGVILALDEDGLWQQRTRNARRQGSYTDAFLDQPDGNIYAPGEATEPARAFGEGRLRQSLTLAAERDAALGLLRGHIEGRLPASDVFDVELTGRFLAIVDLWSAEHQLDWHNLRFYYNPMTGRLEPIGFDAEPPLEPAVTLLAPATSFGWLDDPQIGAVYVRSLRRLTAPDYVDGLRAALGARHDELAKTLRWEFGVLPQPWPTLVDRQRLLRLELDPFRLLHAFVARTDKGFAVTVRNAVTLPVEVRGLRFADTDFPLDQPRFLNPTRSTRKGAAGEFVELALPAELAARLVAAGPEPIAIEVEHRLAGDDAFRRAVAVPYPPALAGPVIEMGESVEAVLAAHPFLRFDADQGALIVTTGEWVVTGDLCLPRGVALVMTGPTTLSFATGASLLAEGPLRFSGAADTPVVLRPASESWAGILVVRAGEPSEFRGVEVRGTTGVVIPGLGLTGGITFFESPLTAIDSRIIGTTAEDALNVMRGSVDLIRVEVAETTSDAFDGDFVHGKIIGSTFRDIGGDAIDVSGSEIEIEQVVGTRIADKLLSIGEASRARVVDLLADTVGIGIASKDRSEVSATRVTIRSARTTALAAYVKKPEYGPASIDVSELTTTECPTVNLVDAGSWVSIDGVRIEGTPLDVKQLYAAGILGN